MKENKRCLANFSFYDQPAIQKTLEDMAAQGWMLQKTGRFFWTYRQIPPQKLRFAVTYFPDASDFDPAPTDEQLTKEEFCAMDGWQLAARFGSMQIFYSAQPDIVSIETDPLTQVENIHCAMKKAVLFPQLISLALVLVVCLSQFALFRQDPIDFLSRGTQLYLVPLWLEMLVISLIEIAACFSWYRKAQKAAEDGVFLPVKSRKKVNMLFSLLSLFFLLLILSSINASLAVIVIALLIVCLTSLAAYGIKQHLKKKGVSRSVNQVVTIASVVLLMLLLNAAAIAAVISGYIHLPNESTPIGTYTYDNMTWDIYDDPLPLTIEDLMAVNVQWSKQQKQQETILLASTTCSQRALLTESRLAPDLKYTVITPKIPALYPLAKQALLDAHQDIVHGASVFRDSYFPIDAAPWQAEEAYQLHWSDTSLDTYLICWPDRIVEIHFSWTPTPEQIAIVCDKLRP